MKFNNLKISIIEFLINSNIFLKNYGGKVWQIKSWQLLLQLS